MIRKLRSNKKVLILAVMLAMLALNVTAAFAQDATPIPIEVPTDEIFTQTNNWIAIFAPIVAIGAGISIALAVLNFIVSQIVRSFKNSGGR